MSSSKAGATQNVRFAVSVDGIPPVFATTPFAPAEIKTDKVQTTLLSAISINPGQTILIMVAMEGSDQDITITDLAINIEGPA